MFANKLQKSGKCLQKVQRANSTRTGTVTSDFSWLLKAVCNKVAERQRIAKVVVAVQ